MFNPRNGRRVRQMNLPNAVKDDSLASSIYVRDYYLKDFKYISPEALASKKKLKLADEEDKTLLEKWFLEVVKGLKQFFYQ
ncbi:Uncharacterized protein OBRU01_27178, partial [Operophtera brumata]